MSTRRFPAQRLLAILGVLIMLSASAADTLLIDDFAVADGPSRLGTPWRLVTDGVMGGASAGGLSRAQIDGRRALCLRGEVRLENNGGFVQVALDLAPEGDLDASDYTGIRLLVRGNGETYNLHLKTADLLLPWQSYRSSFPTGPEWREIRLPFGGFESHRAGVPLDTGRVRSLGLVAIGRAFSAELCVAEIGLYRDSP
jgi:hypothetical protein